MYTITGCFNAAGELRGGMYADAEFATIRQSAQHPTLPRCK